MNLRIALLLALTLPLAACTVLRTADTDLSFAYTAFGGDTAKTFDDGRVVQHGETFDAVELTNPNQDDVPVRIALIGWAAAEDGDPQQAEWVIPLGDDLVTVPARSRKMIPMPEDLADGLIVSVKPYPAR